MTPHIPIMIVAVLLAAGVMLVFSGPISDFVHRHPTIKILALAFLILIGVMLVAEGFGQHVNRGYIYFAMAFSLFVELLNMRLRARSEPIELRHSRLPG
jgi:predicted tellurium resistance membrane protein TerC